MSLLNVEQAADRLGTRTVSKKRSAPVTDRVFETSLCACPGQAVAWPSTCGELGCMSPRSRGRPPEARRDIPELQRATEQLRVEQQRSLDARLPEPGPRQIGLA